MKLDLTTSEEEVLAELATKLDLSRNQVMRQALRLYQSVGSGAWKAVEVNPMPMMLCPHENVMCAPGEERCKDCGENLWRD